MARAGESSSRARGCLGTHGDGARAAPAVADAPDRSRGGARVGALRSAARPPTAHLCADRLDRGDGVHRGPPRARRRAARARRRNRHRDRRPARSRARPQWGRGGRRRLRRDEHHAVPHARVAGRRPGGNLGRAPRRRRPAVGRLRPGTTRGRPGRSRRRRARLRRALPDRSRQGDPRTCGTDLRDARPEPLRRGDGAPGRSHGGGRPGAVPPGRRAGARRGRGDGAVGGEDRATAPSGARTRRRARERGLASRPDRPRRALRSPAHPTGSSAKAARRDPTSRMRSTVWPGPFARFVGGWRRARTMFAPTPVGPRQRPPRPDRVSLPRASVPEPSRTSCRACRSRFSAQPGWTRRALRRV